MEGVGPQTGVKTYDTIVRNWSILGTWGTLFLGYLGSRARRRVLGRWKETENRCLREECELAPCSAAFLAAFALVSLEADANDTKRQRRMD